MDLSGLLLLKHKLLHDKELAPVWAYFLDNFGEDSDFIANGERTSHELVEAVVEQIAEQMFGADGKVRNLLLVRVPGQQFIHGGLTVGGRFGGVIFFEDEQIGLVVVPDKPPSIEVKYARFSARPQQRRGEPSRN
jgi:hypothetical protein